MALRDDWFRSPCLSNEAKAEFERRLSSSRSSRAEYLRIQAHALREAEAYHEALEVLNRLANDHPRHLTDWIQRDAGACHEALGHTEAALQAYAAAIGTAKRRGQKGDARLPYASLVVRLARRDLYHEALSNLDDFWDANPIFPAYEFEQFGWSAILLEELGQKREAIEHATRALAAAAKQKSAAAKHPSLGLVGDRQQYLRERLLRIA